MFEELCFVHGFGLKGYGVIGGNVVDSKVLQFFKDCLAADFRPRQQNPVIRICLAGDPFSESFPVIARRNQVGDQSVFSELISRALSDGGDF